MVTRAAISDVSSTAINCYSKMDWENSFSDRSQGIVNLRTAVNLRVIATNNQRNRGHGRKIDFAWTLFEGLGK